MNFTFSGLTPHTFTASPTRADGTPGTIPVPLTWVLSPSTLATLQVQNPFHNQCIVTPAAGANGSATLTASGVDENGAPVLAQATLTFSNIANPTTGYVLTVA